MALLFTSKQTSRKGTIAMSIGMDGIGRSRQMGNLLFEDHIEVIDAPTNRDHGLEAGGNGPLITLSPSRCHKGDNIGSDLGDGLFGKTLDVC